MDAASPLIAAEFLAVDTETNGLARERCELTEVGAVLVGGGELHERWSSLVGVSAPLSPGIQRFTGITQEMADAAPPAEAVLPELARLLRGREACERHLRDVVIVAIDIRVGVMRDVVLHPPGVAREAEQRVGGPADKVVQAFAAEVRAVICVVLDAERRQKHSQHERRQAHDGRHDPRVAEHED